MAATELQPRSLAIWSTVGGLLGGRARVSLDWRMRAVGNTHSRARVRAVTASAGAGVTRKLTFAPLSNSSGALSARISRTR